jgi:hypothetical protein
MFTKKVSLNLIISYSNISSATYIKDEDLKTPKSDSIKINSSSKNIINKTPNLNFIFKTKRKLFLDF